MRLKIKPWYLRLRYAVQGVVLLIFTGLIVLAPSGALPVKVPAIFFGLDPYLTIANILATKSIIPFFAFSLITIFLTLILGRFWCGWLCPMGTVLDLITPRTPANRNLPEGWRRIKYLLLFTALCLAVFGSLGLMFLDPLTILYRFTSVVVLPGVDVIVSGIERLLYPIPGMDQAVMVADARLRPQLLPIDPKYYQGILGITVLFGTILALNWLAPRFWCRYLCPLGGLLGLLSKFAIVKRVVREDCVHCGVCSKRCPTGTIDPANGFRSDAGECTLCLECIASCPKDAQALQTKPWSVRWSDYDPSRRMALSSAGLALAATALFHSTAGEKREVDHLLRPPGGRENDLLTKCMRCGACIRICPTNALQPALLENGLEGLWTPTILPRMGYCDYSCNACTQVCPAEAIPPLSLLEKRETVIGKAYIDQNRCLAWSDHTPCIVCEEMCPLPDKAIQLTDLEYRDDQGTRQTLQVPHVLRDRCIGCGICEYKCPLNGNAAIRVFVPPTEVPF